MSPIATPKNGHKIHTQEFINATYRAAEGNVKPALPQPAERNEPSGS